jgi:hypothetical protein
MMVYVENADMLDPNIIDFMLKRKTDVKHISDTGNSILFYVAAHKSVTPSILESILAAGADLNHLDGDGCNVLMKHLRESKPPNEKIV